MSTLLTFALLASITAAGIRTRRNRWLLAFFVAQGASTVALWGRNQESQLYAFLFTVSTVCILAAATGYLWQATGGLHWQAIVAGLVYGSSSAAFGLLWLGNTHLEYFYQIALGTGTWLAFLGTAALSDTSRTGRILGPLWVAQAAYQYAFILHWNSATEAWIWINNWLPAVLVIAAFTVLAFCYKNNGKSSLNIPQIGA